MLSDLAIFTQKWSNIVAREKKYFLVFATQFPGLSLVHRRSNSTIELKRRGRIASTIELKRCSRRASTIELKRRGCRALTIELKRRGRRASNIELNRHGRRASIIELKRRGRSSAGAPVQSDDSCYLCLALSAGIWPFLSISVCFGIGATIRVGQGIQCLLHAGFFSFLNI